MREPLLPNCTATSLGITKSEFTSRGSWANINFGAPLAFGLCHHISKSTTACVHPIQHVSYEDLSFAEVLAPQACEDSLARNVGGRLRVYQLTQR